MTSIVASAALYSPIPVLHHILLTKADPSRSPFIRTSSPACEILPLLKAGNMNSFGLHLRCGGVQANPAFRANFRN
jgi:hypothetical protein